MKRIGLIVLVIIVSLGLRPSRLVVANAAPPWYAQGASVNTSESMTRVQMMSEEVLLVVEGQEPTSEEPNLAAGSMIGHVTATFVMRNQGTVEESFDVWFPVGAPDKSGRGGAVENFAAWVDEAPATLKQGQSRGQSDRLGPWVAWPVTFPPGRDVTLRVAFDIVPVGYQPYGTFHYILETGAGWWGPIGEGTITFRLPYQVSQSNAVLTPESWGAMTDAYCKPNDFTVLGSDVIWRFTDLDPTQEDNVCLTVLVPSVWEEVVVAQKEAAADPDSPGAHLRLARALGATLSFMPGVCPSNQGCLWQVGDSITRAERAVLSYERVLEFGTQDVEVYVEYLELVGALWCANDGSCLVSAPENLLSALDRALELAPDDERLLRIQHWLAEIESTLAGLFLTPESTPTATAVATPVAASAATATSPLLVATPLATPVSEGWGLCLGVPAVALVTLIVYVKRRGNSAYRS